MIEESEQTNYETFRDCLSTPLMEKSLGEPTKMRRRKGGRGRKNAIKAVVEVSDGNGNDAAELADFIDVGAACRDAVDHVLR